LNIQLKTTGHLFERPFKRIAIHDNAHLQQAIIYVHANEQKHGIMDDFTRSKFSSYHSIAEKQTDIADACYVVDFFGSVEEYKKVHAEQVAWFYSRGWPSSKLE
jgi:hypothetical protein